MASTHASRIARAWKKNPKRGKERAERESRNSGEGKLKRGVGGEYGPAGGGLYSFYYMEDESVLIAHDGGYAWSPAKGTADYYTALNRMGLHDVYEREFREPPMGRTRSKSL